MTKLTIQRTILGLAMFAFLLDCSGCKQKDADRPNATDASATAAAPQNAAETEKARAADERVLAAIKEMDCSDLALINLPDGGDFKQIGAAMDKVRDSGPRAGDWLRAALNADGPGTVQFLVHPNGKPFDVEKNLQPYDGPRAGKFKGTGPDDVEVNVKWYTFGRVDIGVGIADGARIIRVRPIAAKK